jgi:hypothetical protein
MTHYYVTMRDADKSERYALLAGPFAQHSEALALVRAASDAAIAHNAWYHFNSFGTASVETDNPAFGKLNAVLGLAH